MRTFSCKAVRKLALRQQSCEWTPEGASCSVNGPGGSVRFLLTTIHPSGSEKGRSEPERQANSAPNPC